MNSNARWRLFVFISIASVAIYLAWPHAWYWTYQSRDLDRARALLAGNFLWFGPELSGFGHLPGPLYYYWLALPLSIHSSWHSAWIFLLITSTASVCLYYFPRHKYEAWCGFIFILCSVSFWKVTVQFFNPSFLTPFVLLLLHLVRPTDLSPKKWTIAFVLFLLSIQLHLQALALAPLILVKPTGLGRLKWLLYASVLLGLVYAPFFYNHSDQLLGPVQSGKTILTFGFNRTIELFEFSSWAHGFFSRLFNDPILLLSALALFARKPNDSFRSRLKWSAVLASMGWIFYLLTGKNSRYCLVFSILGICHFAFLLPYLLKEQPKIKRIIAVALLALIPLQVILLASRVASNSSSVGASELESGLKAVAEDSKASWENIRERMILAGFDWDHNPKELYPIQDEIPESINSIYFISQKRLGATPELATNRSELLAFLAKRIENNEVKKIILHETRNLFIWKLIEAKGDASTYSFGNIGVGYDRNAQTKHVEKTDTPLVSVKSCNQLNLPCEIVVKANKPSKDLIELSIEGRALSQPNAWIQPEWTQGLGKPYFEIECKDVNTYIELPNFIGFSGNAEKTSAEAVTPIRVRKNWTCKSDIVTVRLKWAYSTVSSPATWKLLPAGTITLRLANNLKELKLLNNKKP